MLQATWFLTWIQVQGKTAMAHHVSSTQVQEPMPFPLSILTHPNFTSEQY